MTDYIRFRDQGVRHNREIIASRFWRKIDAPLWDQSAKPINPMIFIVPNTVTTTSLFEIARRLFSRSKIYLFITAPLTVSSRSLSQNAGPNSSNLKSINKRHEYFAASTQYIIAQITPTRATRAT